MGKRLFKASQRCEVRSWRYEKGKPKENHLLEELWFNVGFACDWLSEHLPCRHYVEDDQCGRPDHRYCVYCRRGQPNKPLSRRSEPTRDSERPT